MDQANVSKLSATQNVLRKKFEKAYTNRLEHEREVNQAMKPLTMSVSSSSSSSPSRTTAHFQSETVNSTPELDLSTKSYSLHPFKSESELIKTNKEKQRDANVLCDSLRMLLPSLLTGDMNCMQSINSILEEMRDLEIIN